MNNVVEIIESTKKQIDEVVELFYQQKEQQAYAGLEGIVNGLAQIVDIFYNADGDKEKAKENIDSLTAALQK